MTRPLAISGATSGKRLRDVFIGKTVKSVAPDPLLVQPAGYGVVVRDLVVVAMKGGVEAGDLRQRGKIGEQRADRRQIVGLMQRRKRREPLQTRDHAMVDQHGTIVIGTAMDDPMADGERTQLKFVPQPGAREHQGGRDVRNGLDRIGPVRHASPAGAGGAQPRTAANSVHLSLDLPAQPAVAIHGEHLELDA